MQEFFINPTIEYIYFSDHDAVRIVIEKNVLIFVLFRKIRYDQARKENLLIF